MKSEQIDIGYRVKLDQFIKTPEMFDQFFKSYYSLFGFSEIKLTKTLVASYFFEYIIKKYMSLGDAGFSIHIYKDYVMNLENYLEVEKLFKIIEGQSINLVTHIPPTGINEEFVSRLILASKQIPENNILLLENPIMSIDVFHFLDQVIKLLRFLENGDIKNVKLCLDIGHLAKNISYQKIELSVVYQLLLRINFFLKNIYEFHFHDFDGINDHVVFEHNNAVLQFSAMIYGLLESNVPIIMETPIGNIEKEGVKQLRLVQREVMKWK